LEHHGVVASVAFGPDGDYALTGSWDYTARFWELAGGHPVGPPLHHRSAVYTVALSPNGKYALTGSGDYTARLWHLPAPWQDSAEMIVRRLSVLTGMDVDESGAVRLLDAPTWRQRREQLQAASAPKAP
jgi:WD40 repeat protein